ncbi:MAG: iron chelate uptake ABC transporter family permease subunit, partial [Chloroflexi bacterium]|nr:iron chelate uptake ABC transporter family permease subunit [Chloroflexota bacterium]
LIFSVGLGSVYIAPLEVIRIFLSRLPLNLIRDWQETSEIILFDIRLPRTLLIVLTGAALGGSGASYQGLFRNPLADPYLIGIASGAGLGAVIAMSIEFPTTLIGLLTVTIAAFVGAMITVAFVYNIARVGKGAQVTTLILAGVAVGSFATAITTFLMLRSQEQLRRAIGWLLGGFALGGWLPVIALLPYIIIGLTVLILFARPLNVLQFGDDQAGQMGLNVERVKMIVIVAASLTTAAAVAFSGIIGFVGLVTPHVIRLVWGPDYRKLIPLSIIGGAAMLLLTRISYCVFRYAIRNTKYAIRNMLTLTSLSLHYGSRTILRDINLKLSRGEVLALVGPNGVGKSTLIKIACGGLKPTHGDAVVDGVSLQRLSPEERARRVAVVSQALRLPEAFTVFDTGTHRVFRFARQRNRSRQKNRLRRNGAHLHHRTCRTKSRRIKWRRTTASANRPRADSSRAHFING